MTLSKDTVTIKYLSRPEREFSRPISFAGLLSAGLSPENETHLTINSLGKKAIKRLYYGKYSQFNGSVEHFASLRVEILNENPSIS